MTLREARALTEYWKYFPPENESLCVFVQSRTSWRPQGPMTEEEVIFQHRKSLEQRWKAGALDPRQMISVMGKTISSDPTHPLSGMQSTGIGPWPPAS